ncbi:DNA polymerase III subunit epsilon [Geobacter sp. SVR]|nr:DNA polymerase III subunit epsilon [Geobacter sp. SVR]GCF85806.1 DNA polymerase III subunit epsilon [Geobacter sp. SVR]
MVGLVGNFTAVVIDFETTGLSPGYGDRTIEVGAVLVSGNRIVDRFQSLMNPGMRVSGFIEEYTGITNTMLSTAPAIKEVMAQLKSFIGQHHLVAHNASFDSRFLDAEFKRIDHRRTNEFACSMLASRRLYPEAPNHRLETLVHYKKLKTDGVHHRALADAEMTAHLWLNMIADIKATYGVRDVPFKLMQQVTKVPKKGLHDFLLKKATQY